MEKYRMWQQHMAALCNGEQCEWIDSILQNTLSMVIGVAKPGHTRATARASLINAPASASYLIFFKID